MSGFIYATILVVVVFWLGRTHANWRWKADAEKIVRRETLKALSYLDRTGSAAKVHDLATEMVIEATDDEYRGLVSQSIELYRENLPIASLKVAWQEKVGTQ